MCTDADLGDALLARWMAAAIARARPDAEIRTADFATLTLREQIRIAAESDVLVGVHGAGLTHVLWMRPGTKLVEIIPPATERACFGNLAAWVGVRHATWQDADPTEDERRTAVHTPLVRVDVAAVATLVSA